MNRVLQSVNLIGVVVLVALCVLQWAANGKLHAQLEDVRRTVARQEQQLEADQRNEEGQRADMEDLRGRLVAAQKEVAASAGKMASLTGQMAQAKADQAALQKAYDNVNGALSQWRKAVEERDATLKKVNEIAQQAAADRNEAVTRYNALVAQYNAAGVEIQKAGEVIKQLAAQRDEAIRKFNELAAKYNALVTGGGGGTATKPG